MKSLPTPRVAAIELIFAAMIWGFGFTATIWALDFVGPLTMTAGRFVLSYLFIQPFLFRAQVRSLAPLKLFKMSMGPGILLSLVLVLQTWGLKYTTATKSGFITTLYVVIVPLIEYVVLKKNIRPVHWFYVLVALVGTALICNFQGGDWNRGDILTFLCAILAAWQIVMIGQMSHEVDSPIAFNAYQSLWASIAPLALLLFFPEQIHLAMSGKAILGLASLTFGSTIFAFMLQIRAQKVLSSSVASILFLLESPFAAVFAFIFINEQLDFIQWLGGGLILISAYGAVRESSS